MDRAGRVGPPTLLLALDVSVLYLALPQLSADLGAHRRLLNLPSPP
ncbi:hypothetical protein [Phytohabitans houttuyneae]|nr:hypothetical protein [Phytohabitans houttuyneae]